MSDFLFHLGHQPHISEAEIFSVLKVYNIVYKKISRNDNFLVLDIPKDFSPNEYMDILGGTVKISERLDVLQADDIEDRIISYLTKIIPEGKINFSLSGPNAEKLAIAVKKKIKADGRSARYIPPKNTATIVYNSLIKFQSDLLIFEGKLYVTRAVQTIEEFAERDYERPQSDSKSGMLPPKLARILINLSEAKKNDKILDPFCGSGTIIVEALDLGYTKVQGSDISSVAVQNTKENIHWYTQKNGISISPVIFLSDAGNLEKIISTDDIDAIITEPYLGKPLTGRESLPEIKDQADELSVLYKKSFKSFHKVLKQSGTVIFIVPEFKYKNEWVPIPCLPDIKKTGFVTTLFANEQTSLLYARPNQFVGRRIWKLKKV